MMLVCPATNHGAVSECGNIVVGAPSSPLLRVELAVACPPSDGCGEPAGADAVIWAASPRSIAIIPSSATIQIVFRQRTFLGRLLYGFLPTGGGRTAECRTGDLPGSYRSR